MTNEEVIFYLKQIKEDYKEFIEGIKAIDFAINTLKKDPIVDYNTGYQDGLEDGLNNIRPQGKWIFVDSDLGFHKCSICEFSIDAEEIEFYNYCPCCGAALRNEDEEEN